MRHRLCTRLGLAATLSSLLLIAGCGRPGGVDGNLTNGWQAMAAPTGFVPAANTCHSANFAKTGTRGTYEEVDCGLRHRTETTHVGTYTGAAAEADTPPADASAGARQAYQTCDTKTTAYVGGPWRTARLWIGVTQPSAAAWRGGARWFRCDVLEMSSVENDGVLVQRVGSLRDALKQPNSPLLLSCYSIKLNASGSIDAKAVASCATRHNAEFVGVYEAGGDLPFPKRDAQWVELHDGCRALIGKYVGVPADKDLQYRTGVVSLPGDEAVWALGDRGVRCYLWLEGATLTSSLRGKGDAGMPIQYK